MLKQTSEFIQDQHLFSSLLTINPKLSSPQLLTSNLSAIPNLLAIYKQHNDTTDLRSQCLSSRSLSATRFIVSLQQMEENVEIVAKPVKLIQSNFGKEGRVLKGNVEGEKVSEGCQVSLYETNVEEGRKRQEDKGTGVSDGDINISREVGRQGEEESRKQKKEQSNSEFEVGEESSVSGVFTEVKNQNKPIRRKVETLNTVGRNRSFESEILPNEDALETSNQHLLEQYFKPITNNNNFSESQKQGENKIDDQILELQDSLEQRPDPKQNQRPIKQFSPLVYISEARNTLNDSQSQTPDSQDSLLIKQFYSKRLPTEQTHPASPLPQQRSLSQKSHLRVSPNILSIHEILKVNRSNRSKDTERQRHVAEFSQKVEQQLREIKEELKEIRQIQNNISESRISDRRMTESRITSKGTLNTFNPTKNKSIEPTGKARKEVSEPKTLKFDLSQSNSLTPRPSKQLLTVSRSINMRNDSRPTPFRPQQSPELSKSKVSYERKRQEKSLENFQKAMQIAKPKPRDLLTTRIAKYN